MNARPSKDPGVANVLRAAMKGALESGMKPTQLLAIVLNVAGHDTVGVLKTTMKCALDRGTKPDVLINVAVEVAFKNQNQPSKEVVPAEKPIIGNAIEDGSKPDKPASGAVEGNTIFTPTIAPFNFNIAAVVNQNASLKRAQTTDKPPRKKQKIAMKDGQRENFLSSDSDTTDQSDSSDSSSSSGKPMAKRNKLGGKGSDPKPQSETKAQKAK
ncbi:hypothetical protein VE00_10124 [Pseudogymnoascus sp. WSF 3629]|nr:hypothetical protein VE00_10124 [Pseudogymnoascus sp. WSF 3629]